MAIPELHIVTFAVPFPANYGGAIDAWNRLMALNREGVRIHLHCFVYGTFKPAPVLADIAHKVHYYPRVKWPVFFSRDQPYIVTSRKSKELLQNLMLDRHPILFDGIHTTGFARELKDRKLLLRAHNIEHEYYAALADQSYGVKSLIFRRESLCLRGYESDLAGLFDVVLAISPQDHLWFADHGAKSVFMPPFHGLETVDIEPGHGQYILYQGDLSIKINQDALLDLMQRIPTDQPYPVVAAGRSGDRTFEDKLARFPNLQREADVSHDRMLVLIRQAHIVMIHSLHASGMKLKFFPALYYGRFVGASAISKTSTTLDRTVDFYQPEEVGGLIERCWQQDFTTDMVKERSLVLGQLPTDHEKAKEILRYL